MVSVEGSLGKKRRKIITVSDSSYNKVLSGGKAACHKWRAGAEASAFLQLSLRFSLREERNQMCCSSVQAATPGPWTVWM